MDRELIDRAWRILPAEFKRVVKAHYAGLNAAYKAYLSKDSLTNEECDRCKAIREKIVLYNMYFGHHNLISDAEGEEMLTVPRKKVQELFNEYQELYGETKGKCHDKEVALSVSCFYGKMCALSDLFGSKCLPDNGTDCTPVKEPKPDEPKFTKEDMVHCKTFGYEGDYKVIEYVGGSSKCYDCIDRNGYYFRFYESDLEPYTEPEEKHIAGERKMVDNIIKDGFSKERRLNIAAMIAQGIMANSNPQMVDMNVERVVDLAILTADTLIAECECTDKLKGE